MDRNKVVILILIIAIVALLAGIFASMPNFNKQDTNVTYKGTAILNESSSINVMLTDIDGTPLVNQTVNITVTDKDKSSDYHSVVTDEKGIGKLKLDKSAGKYNLTMSYGGDDKYNGCSATKKITVQEETAGVSLSQGTVSQTSSNTQVVMGEDGYYYLIDDNGNFLESLGPSKKHYPNKPNAVDYPDAEFIPIDKSVG